MRHGNQKGGDLHDSGNYEFPSYHTLLEEAVLWSRDGIVIADATTPALPLIYVNPAFERITGYSASDALGYNCRFLQGSERQQEGLKVLRAALRRGDSCDVVLRNFRKDGSLFWNELHISPIHDGTGQLTHFVGIQSDVTDRVRAEQQSHRLQSELRERNAQLKRLNEEKNQLLGMAAHDIRNPLSSIVLNSDMLLRERAGSLVPKQSEITRRIRRTADFMLHLVNDLLDVSRIESGKLELRTATVNLVELVRQNLEAHQHRAEQKKITLAFKEPAHPALCEADRDRMLQVIDNLVSNAVKFSPPQTRVKIQIHVRSTDVTLSVCDQGTGIPKDEMSKLFKPFSKTSVRATAGEKSTGLGLAISRRIIAAHEGYIWAHSREGKGTKFFVRLPAAKAPPPGTNGDGI